MKTKKLQPGISLIETTIVVAVIAMLASLSGPAIRAFYTSLGSEAGTQALISASLASARAIAAKEHRYAGIRFQQAYNPNNPGPLKADQYLIFIIHDQPNTGLSNGFRVVEGVKAIKLPENIGVMEAVTSDIDVATNLQLTGVTTFSIIFSPSGKMVQHDVQVRNRDGRPAGNHSSFDEIFNTDENVINNGIAMFIQDDYPALALDKETSHRDFVIYNRRDFEKITSTLRYTNYLQNLNVVNINPYTGTIISGR